MEQRYREESRMVRAAQEAINHRPNFAIDAIGDSDGEDDDDVDGQGYGYGDGDGAYQAGGGDGDGDVMDEVEAFLKANGADDEGLKGEQKRMASGELFSMVVWCDEGCDRGYDIWGK